MKPTYKNIALYFNIKSYQTVSTMAKNNPLMYEALRDKFLKDNAQEEKDR